MRPLITFVLLLAGAPALAQAPLDSGFDAHGFKLAAHDADARDPLVVPRPGRFEAQSWFLGGLLEYASQPLVFEPASGRIVALDDVVGANLSAGYAPHQRVRLDLSMPLFFYAEGERNKLGAGLGDLRATGLVNLVSPDSEGGLGLGLLVNVDVPTGRPEAYLGQYTVSGGVGLAATLEIDAITFTALGSSQLRPNTDPALRPLPTRGGDAFTWGAGLGYMVSETVGMNVEVHGEVPVDAGVQAAIGVPAEALLSLRQVRDDGAFLTAGLGTALSRGAGSSPLRLLLGGGFGKLNIVRDADGDGVLDDVDACPTEPETRNSFEDSDGCPDELPKLVFRAVGSDGKARADAELTITSPVRTTGRGELEFQGPDSMPGSVWEVDARVGKCLEGHASVTMGPKGDAVDIAMNPLWSSKLQIEVVDVDGNAVQGSAVVVRSEDGPCVPNKAIPLSGNTGSVDVGEGTHSVMVTAEGFRVVQEAFSVERGGTHTIRAVLAPTKVEFVGEEIKILDKVYFETGKAKILPRSFELLDEVAEVVSFNGISRLEIQGHTDSQGAERMNLDLSQRRAEAVKEYLVGKAIPPENLDAKGYGESTPIASNGSPSGRAQNRRVQFQVLGFAE